MIPHLRDIQYPFYHIASTAPNGITGSPRAVQHIGSGPAYRMLQTGPTNTNFVGYPNRRNADNIAHPDSSDANHVGNPNQRITEPRTRWPIAADVVALVLPRCARVAAIIARLGAAAIAIVPPLVTLLLRLCMRIITLLAQRSHDLLARLFQAIKPTVALSHNLIQLKFVSIGITAAHACSHRMKKCGGDNG